MKIRLGYVALPVTINITSSRTLTFTSYKKNKENSKLKLDNIIKSNLESLYQILKYNQANNIHFYRLTSKLIPLSTIVKQDYLKKYKKDYFKISKFIKNNNMRIDLHPDQFVVLNSINNNVFNNSKDTLNYHLNILRILNIKNPIIILHLGSSSFGKQKSIERFIKKFNELDIKLKKSIALENDDKIYNINDILYVCEKLQIPFVLDYHHYICNNNNEKIENYIERIFNTWKEDIPKIHFSSSKNNTKKDYRSHNDYINSNDFIKFIEKVKVYNRDFDVMIEAKKKDDALFKLVRELKYLTNYTFIDDTTFIVK